MVFLSASRRFQRIRCSLNLWGSQRRLPSGPQPGHWPQAPGLDSSIASPARSKAEGRSLRRLETQSKPPSSLTNLHLPGFCWLNCPRKCWWLPLPIACKIAGDACAGCAGDCAGRAGCAVRGSAAVLSPAPPESSSLASTNAPLRSAAQETCDTSPERSLNGTSPHSQMLSLPPH